MKTIQRWIVTLLVSIMYKSVYAFQSPQLQSSKHTTALNLATLELSDIMSAVSSAHDMSSELSAIISTTLSTAVTAAHGHTNPVFGQPDPYLAAGKSIAPSVQALSELGITPARTVGELIPDAPEDFQHSVAQVVKAGRKVLDFSHIHGTGVNHLPGFADTRGIFGSRMVPMDTTESFVAELQWANNYFRIMDKLPFVAFYYALLEFFILRPGVDLYKEEIEDDPNGVFVESVAVSTVRLGAFALVSFATVVFS